MKLGVSTRIYDSANVKELVASTLRSYGNNTMRKRGVDIANLGVDIAILGVDTAILGEDIAVLGVHVAILGVDIAILGVDIAILRRQEKGWGLQGEGEEGEVSRVRRLEAGWSTHGFGDTRSHKGS